MLLMLSGGVGAAERITLASTTSTENSGLLEWLLPKFTAAFAIEVQVIAVGTGQALRIARNGDADVLMTHAEAAEKRFVASGWGLARHPLMYNDFIVVGPADDPAGISAIAGVAQAFKAIAATAHPFVSRGDDSGTHSRELEIWHAAGLMPEPDDNWYREMGAGMGATLNAAAAMGAYTIVDRATWLSFGNRDSLAVLAEGDPALFNQYAVIPVNPARHPHVRAEAAGKLVTWLLGPEGQAAIGAFRLRGQQVFFTNAQTGK